MTENTTWQDRMRDKEIERLRQKSINKHGMHFRSLIIEIGDSKREPNAPITSSHAHTCTSDLDRFEKHFHPDDPKAPLWHSCAEDMRGLDWSIIVNETSSPTSDDLQPHRLLIIPAFMADELSNYQIYDIIVTAVKAWVKERYGMEMGNAEV